MKLSLHLGGPNKKLVIITQSDQSTGEERVKRRCLPQSGEVREGFLEEVRSQLRPREEEIASKGDGDEHSRRGNSM